MKTNSQLLLLLSPFCTFHISMAQDASKPNIILIMADDLGWGDVGFNGNTRIQTPCLDRLSSEGVIFDQFYSSAPLSSPTRASVLTGRNAYRMGVFAPNVGILRPEEKTLPKLLKEKGYTTSQTDKKVLRNYSRKEQAGQFSEIFETVIIR